MDSLFKKLATEKLTECHSLHNPILSSILQLTHNDHNLFRCTVSVLDIMNSIIVCLFDVVSIFFQLETI